MKKVREEAPGSPTLAQVGEKMLTDAGTISRWELNKSVPSKGKLVKWAEILDVDPHEALARRDGTLDRYLAQHRSAIHKSDATEPLNAIAHEAGMSGREFALRLSAWLDRQSAEFRRFIIDSIARSGGADYGSPGVRIAAGHQSPESEADTFHPKAKK